MIKTRLFLVVLVIKVTRRKCSAWPKQIRVSGEDHLVERVVNSDNAPAVGRYAK